MQISLTVPPIQEIYYISNNKVRVLSNTGEALSTTFIINGITYQLEDCDLPTGKYIDTTCDLVPIE